MSLKKILMSFLMVVPLLAAPPVAQETAEGLEIDWVIPTFNEEVIQRASDTYLNGTARFACLYGDFKHIPNKPAISEELRGKRYLYLTRLELASDEIVSQSTCLGAQGILAFWREPDHDDAAIHAAGRNLIAGREDLTTAVVIIGTNRRQVDFGEGLQWFDSPVILFDSRLSEWAKCYFNKVGCNEWR